MLRIVIILAIVLTLPACGAVMEASRPDPVNVSQFKVGESRINVIADLGNASGTIEDQGNPCEIYKLYTEGPNSLGKGFLTAGEVVTDVFTLGLAEVIWTPVEGMTRNTKHTVIFCYNADGKLISVTKSEAATGSE